MACREGGTEGGGGRRGKGGNEEGGRGKIEGQYLYLRVGYATV